jgi:hypothetical protein
LPEPPETLKNPKALLKKQGFLLPEIPLFPGCG